ncbi:hypothetical protein [Burkholderia stagnalis]|uniref:hypothetical protein n=1 Tax=Burkholderia stagnalis TaxID=1503054 RepID=UPI000F5D12CA|nr:hypothetical protein [Burkholderia stagnalis]
MTDVDLAKIRATTMRLQAEAAAQLDEMQTTRRWERWVFLACEGGLIVGCGFALGMWLLS